MIRSKRAMSDFVEVRIYGQTFKLRAGAGREYIEQLAGHVDGVMRQMARLSTSPATDRIAVMAALNIADALLQQEKRSDNETRIVNGRISRLVDSSDRLLKG